MTAAQRRLGLVLLLFLCFLGLGRALWTPDEPREAEISREMALSPRVVPSLNGHDFIEKPPLYYWTVATVFSAVGASPAAARGVSAAASFLTLLLVFLWGRREFSEAVGFAAALGLATSTQFLISSHWIVMDPLLMLFTTAALWAGAELVRGRGNAKVLLGFYAALSLALWTKGLVGPVLVACGLLAYAAAQRSLRPVWNVRPFMGTAVLVLMTGVIAALIYVQSGAADVREWLWVNHVQRFVDPSYTGHDQPFYYYLSAVPIAVFPWWVPFGALFRPSSWRGARSPGREIEIYLGAVCLGMVLILSAAATKRGLYLLPMLPPLLLLLAARAEAWWKRRPEGPLKGYAWWWQAAFVVLLAAAPTALVLGYLRRLDAAALGVLAVVALLTAALAIYSRRGDSRRTLAALGACAVVGVVGLLAVDTRLAAPIKDMTPFVASIGAKLPPDAVIHVTGDIDETVNGILPFVTGDRVVETMPAEIAVDKPRYVVVQDKHGGRTAPRLPAAYQLLAERHFGPGRYLALWRLGAGRAPGPDTAASARRPD
ncbi:MAG TPA: glycosyltransferase family 39 protein [Gammaproteobacteria bacterium]|nr:glycosyltransferase family 39 protein [Gammaproteobacteria bacterium]